MDLVVVIVLIGVIGCAVWLGFYLTGKNKPSELTNYTVKLDAAEERVSYIEGNRILVGELKNAYGIKINQGGMIAADTTQRLPNANWEFRNASNIRYHGRPAVEYLFMADQIYVVADSLDRWSDGTHTTAEEKVEIAKRIVDRINQSRVKPLKYGLKTEIEGRIKL